MKAYFNLLKILNVTLKFSEMKIVGIASTLLSVAVKKQRYNLYDLIFNFLKGGMKM